MCGIAGFFGQGSEDILRTMTDSLSYRGPDGAGYFFNGEVGFGHRRLSIIDLSERGTQPMWNEDATVAVIFNGEIYNFLTLREKLQTLGHTFQSGTDTEVLVHGYEVWGSEIFSKIDGMFSIALYDMKQKLLYLARDRFGKKPLYYFSSSHQYATTVVFGSEIKALLKHPAITKELDMNALCDYLLYEYVPAPKSIFKNIQKVMPGHFICFQNGKLMKLERYFSLPTARLSIEYEDAKTALDTLLQNAVTKRLRSDVPLGVFLSGGIDSSTVAYYAAKTSRTPLHTFSIAFDEKSYDESRYARVVASALHTQHHEESVRMQDALHYIPEIYSALDEPLGDASLIPTYVLSKMTRKYVTVALGGDGADELLYGYQTFTAAYHARMWWKMPKLTQNIFQFLSHVVPDSQNYFNLKFKLDRFSRGWDTDPLTQDILWRGSFLPQEIAQLKKDAVPFKVRSDLLLHDRLNEFSFFHALSEQYIYGYLTDDILVKVDRASMYNSLEVRAPFLDTALASFIFSLPDAYKMRRGKGKRILRDVMRGKIPDRVIDRPKKGFAVPIATWLRKDLHPLVEELLGDTYILKQGIFDPAFVRTLVVKHQNRTQDYRKELWTLLVFQMWYKNYMCI